MSDRPGSHSVKPNLLLLDGIGLAHLGAEASIQNEAQDPCALSVVQLPITRTAFF